MRASHKSCDGDLMCDCVRKILSKALTIIFSIETKKKIVVYRNNIHGMKILRDPTTKYAPKLSALVDPESS